MLVNDLKGDRKTQTRATVFRRVERVECMLESFGGQSGAFVLDDDPDSVTIEMKEDADLSTLRHGLNPVDHQIKNCLSQALLVGFNRGNGVVRANFNHDALICRLLSYQIDDRIDDSYDIAGYPFGRVCPHEVELPSDDGGDALDFLLHDTDELVTLVVRRGHRVEDLDSSGYAAEGIPDLMRDSGRQRPQGRQSIEKPHTLEGRVELLVGLYKLLGNPTIALPLSIHPVDQEARHRTEDHKQNDLGELVRSVQRIVLPLQQNVRQVGHRGQRSNGQAASNPVHDGTNENRNVVESLVDDMPVLMGWVGQVMKQADRHDACYHPDQRPASA